MNGRINYQVIEQDGKPVFAVVPYDEFQTLLGSNDESIPHEVVKKMVEHDCNLVKAWRLVRNFSQEFVADKMGISQSAYQQLENSDGRYQRGTLEKLALALDVSVGQLKE
jgi:DNA-binding XRE family transcriptional regulator